MHFRGLVLERTVAPGSKSERSGFVLQSDKGEFVLRRQGSNPFEPDSEFGDLVGHEIDVEGKVLDYLLIVDSWHRADDQESHSDEAAG